MQWLLRFLCRLFRIRVEGCCWLGNAGSVTEDGCFCRGGCNVVVDGETAEGVCYDVGFAVAMNGCEVV